MTYSDTAVVFQTQTHTQLIACEIRINHNIIQKKMHLAVAKTRKRLKPSFRCGPVQHDVTAI